MYKKSIFIVIFLFCTVSGVFAEGDLKVTEIPGITGWGSISADGRTLVIARGKNYDPLVLYDVESGKQSLVLKGRVVHHPRLDPSGRKIIFSSDKPYAGLWIVGTDGKGLQPFPSKQGKNTEDHNAIWSPDGSRVVWARGWWTEGTQVWIANADGSEARVLIKSSSDHKSMDIGYPIDWIENKILTSGTKGSTSPALYITDASSGKFINSGIEHEGQALFCESPDYLMYYNYGVGRELSFWSVSDKEKAAGTVPLKMSLLVESIDYFSRSADSSILLVNNEDSHCLDYMHIYLVRSGDKE